MKTQRRNFLSVYFLSVLVVAGTLSFLAAPALAELVTFNFTGTIYNVGDPVTGSITYNTSLGYIQPPPSGMSVVIGSDTIQSAGDASLQVINDNNGVDNFNGFFTPVSVNGEPPSGGSMLFYLGDTSQTAFSITALPCTLDVNSFNIRHGSISAGSIAVSFSIDTLEGGCEIQCITDADCNDGVFCNGTETCSNGNCVAVSACSPYVDGCVIRGSICDEANDQCLDVADDSRCDIGQTCDAITGECLTPCRVAQQTAQEAVASGGTYKNKGEILKTATKSVIGYLYDGVISQKCLNCILSQFARGIPIYEQQACQ